MKSICIFFGVVTLSMTLVAGVPHYDFNLELFPDGLEGLKAAAGATISSSRSLRCMPTS